MDSEKFSSYWNEAVTAVVYKVYHMKKPITTAAINQCWREELLEHRFFSTGIRHGAAVWLSELEAAEPQVADRLRKALDESGFQNAGLGSDDVGPAAIGAAATAAGSIWMKAASKPSLFSKIGSALALVTGIGLLGKGAADVISGSTNPEKVCSALRKEAEQQLAAILQSVNG